MFSPPPIADLLPTGGTVRTETDYRYTASQNVTEGDEYLFNTKDYHRAYSYNFDAARQEYIRQFQRKLGQLMLRFKKSWERERKAFSGIPENQVSNISGISAFLILSTKPEKVGVDLTADSTVFFTAIYPHVKAYVELHFALGENPEVVFNIYENDAPAMAFAGSVPEAFNRFLGFFSKK